MWKPKGYHAYRGNRRRPLLRVLIVLLCLAVAAFAALEGIIFVGGQTRIDHQPDVMLILGCQVKASGPSIMLRDRLDAALSYLEMADETMTIVVSGGKGNDEHVSEAEAMYDYLVEHGVDSKRIHQESESRNTSQNLQNSKALLESLGYDMESTNVLLVTNDFHLTRAAMLAERYGIQTSQLAAPATHIPSRIHMFFREPLALVKSFLLD